MKHSYRFCYVYAGAIVSLLLFLVVVVVVVVVVVDVTGRLVSFCDVNHFGYFS